MNDKQYNTHLVQLWLDNNHDNYVDCASLNEKRFKVLMQDDAALLTWLTFREYGGDREKIVLDKDALYLDAIRETIKENREAQ